MTPAQRKALRWLGEHNGTGVFDKHGVLLAGGELAPCMRSTWSALQDLGFVILIWKCTGKKRPVARVARVEITLLGAENARSD